jgi:hypothetical protein
VPLNPSLGLKKPGSSTPFASDPSLANKIYSHVNNNPAPAAVQTSAPVKPVKKDFSLVDFSKNRFKTQQALKGTLKNSADRKDVANALSDLRGYGGITKSRAKSSLSKLGEKKGWSPGKVWAVRRKMGI